MTDNPLCKLEQFGQSIWLDFLRRNLVTSGHLQKLVDDDGLKGITSNPSIFEKAISGSSDYDAAVKAWALEGKAPDQMYTTLSVQDIQAAADVLRPTWERLKHADGFVSLEVDPNLAYEAEATMEEARRLWSLVDRPNIFIKVPATLPGLQAIRQLTAEGLNINVTLLFGLPRYVQVAEAYIEGLRERLRQGLPIDDIHSVASFFLSRIDVLIDPQLEEIIERGGDKAELAKRLLGQVAIASAREAYRIAGDIYGREPFLTLKQKGAKIQRLLWASTSTKNPNYPDLKYVEALIAPETVNTLPMETLDAYRDHGKPAVRITDDPELTQEVLARLPEVGIDLAQVTQQLEEEGVQKFSEAFDKLMKALTEKRSEALQQPLDRQSIHLPSRLQQAVQERLERLQQEDFSTRLWRKDATLWKSDPENQKTINEGLGWLHVAEKMEASVTDLKRFVAEVREAGFKHVLHMGMGGSSLAPLVFERHLPVGEEGLPVTVLDTTDPATIQKLADELPLAETLFIVASKSGATAEPQAFEAFFWDKLQQLKGDKAGENFVVVTDAGSMLAKQAEERHYRHIFINFADIGGRYSALSYFGMVPAALQGVDVGELIARALKMTEACAAEVPLDKNPGAMLGIAMGEAALAGRDKLTFLIPDDLETLGLWLEQLIAESTGKEGKGILPVAREPLGDVGAYGTDRLFALITVKDEPAQDLIATAEALRQAGHPVVTIRLDDRLDIGQEFLRWEIATATAGAVLGINPFDQPNVQESKDNTNRLLKQAEEQGHLPEPQPLLTEGGLSVYGPLQARGSVAEALAEFLRPVHSGDYLNFMVYLTETPETDAIVQAMRRELRDALHVPVTAGYGPRFLHSTGQYHKGGPNTGVFIQLTATPAAGVNLPGKPYDLATFIKAQELGDVQALEKHGRRALRVDLGDNVQGGLQKLQEAVAQALGQLRP